MQCKCKDCYNVYYSTFCGYTARYCKKHGCIDCNPDSYLNTLKENEKCPDFITFEELKRVIEKKKENNIIDLKIIDKLIEDSMELFKNEDLKGI